MNSPAPQLNLVVLRSPDIERAVKFYQQIGLMLTRHSHGKGPEHYASEINGMVFEIYSATEKSRPTLGTRIGFIVDSVNQLIPLLEEIGAEILTPPTDSEWGRRAVVKDLDGHVVELITRNQTDPSTSSG
jgi:predicted enzyme related to lactoylglutathione lyase